MNEKEKNKIASRTFIDFLICAFISAIFGLGVFLTWNIIGIPLLINLLFSFIFTTIINLYLILVTFNYMLMKVKLEEIKK